MLRRSGEGAFTELWESAITRFSEIGRGAPFRNIQTQLLKHLAAICAGRDCESIGLSDLSALHEHLLAWFKKSVCSRKVFLSPCRRGGAPRVLSAGRSGRHIASWLRRHAPINEGHRSGLAGVCPRSGCRELNSGGHALKRSVQEIVMIEQLELSGIAVTVYVAKFSDDQLAAANVSRGTTEILRHRMRNSKALLYVHSQHSKRVALGAAAGWRREVHRQPLRPVTNDGNEFPSG